MQFMVFYRQQSSEFRVYRFFDLWSMFQESWVLEIQQFFRGLIGIEFCFVNLFREFYFWLLYLVVVLDQSLFFVSIFCFLGYLGKVFVWALFFVFVQQEFRDEFFVESLFQMLYFFIIGQKEDSSGIVCIIYQQYLVGQRVVMVYIKYVREGYYGYFYRGGFVYVEFSFFSVFRIEWFFLFV